MSVQALDSRRSASDTARRSRPRSIANLSIPLNAYLSVPTLEGLGKIGVGDAVFLQLLDRTGALKATNPSDSQRAGQPILRRKGCSIIKKGWDTNNGRKPEVATGHLGDIRTHGPSDLSTNQGS